MHRGALHFGAFLLTLIACSPVFAHGFPPVAYAVLSHDAQGPRAVSFSSGVALRVAPQRYQYVCPMVWNDQFASPLSALPDGTIVVGATDGLLLLGPDGTLRPHPDPAAVGRSDDVVRSPRGDGFSIRPSAQGTEVLSIDAQTVRVLWKDTNTLYSMAALDDRLVLVRANGMMLEQVAIATTDGAVIERQTAVLESGVDYVYARANAGAAYVLVVYRSGTMALGSLQTNAFTKLAEGELSIAGPLSVENVMLLALDGKLEQLAGGQSTPLAGDPSVVCLAEHDGLAYACDADGIARVSAQTLGEPLFRFEWLVPPDLTRVPEGDQRFLCNSQWQDLRFDIQLRNPDFGMMPIDPPIAGAGGAQPPVTGGVGAPAVAGSYAPAVAGTGPAAGSGAPVVGPAAPAQQSSSGCAMLPTKDGSRAADTWFAFVLALAAVRSRRRWRTGQRKTTGTGEPARPHLRVSK
jgi:hypothetical protein